MHVPNFLKRQTISQATILIFTIFFISKFFGLFRDVFIAKFFGITGITDAFFIALIIPTSILGIVSNGFNTLIIPIYIEKKNKGIKEIKSFVNSIFIFFGGIILIISIIIFIFAPYCVNIIAYGFKENRFELSVLLTRYLIISGVFTSLTGILKGLFESEKQFLIPTFLLFLGNVSLILSLIIFHSYLGIHSWTLGQISSAFIPFFFMLVLSYYKYNFFHSFHYQQFNWNEIKQFILLLLPLIISDSLSMLNQVIDKTIASSLTYGSIAALNFAQRILKIPISLLGNPIAIAIFPSFSKLSLNKSTRQQYETHIEKIIGILLYLTIPSTVFIYFMSKPIIKLLFERGKFDINSTYLTSSILKMYIIGLLAHTITPILVKVFYSFKNTKTPLIISAICVNLNIVLNIVLAKRLGSAGIALATSIVMSINTLLCCLFLKKILNPFTSNLAFEFTKILISAFPIGIICYFSKSFFQDNLLIKSVNVLLIVKIMIVGVISIIFYALFSHILKLNSYLFFKSYAYSRIKKIISKG